MVFRVSSKLHFFVEEQNSDNTIFLNNVNN